MSAADAIAMPYREPRRYEFLDGKLVSMSPMPTPNHNRAIGNIFNIFKNFLKNNNAPCAFCYPDVCLGKASVSYDIKNCEVFTDGVDVYMDKDTVIPDVFIVCDKNKIKGNGIYGAPDLIVEVLSPTTLKRDKGYKMKLYERCGVKEYWLVSTECQSVDIYVLKEGKLTLTESHGVIPSYLIEKMEYEEDRAVIIESFSSTLFPDLEIKLDDMFENIINK